MKKPNDSEIITAVLADLSTGALQLLALLKLLLATRITLAGGHDLQVTLRAADTDYEELFPLGITRAMRDLLACTIPIKHEPIPIISEVTVRDGELCLTFPRQVAKYLFPGDHDISPATRYIAQVAMQVAAWEARLNEEMHQQP